MANARYFAGGAWLLFSVAAVASFLQAGALSKGLVAGFLPLILFMGVAIVLLGAYAIGRVFDSLERYSETRGLRNSFAYCAARRDSIFEIPGLSPALSLLRDIETVKIVYANYAAVARDLRPLKKSEVIMLSSFPSYKVAAQTVDAYLSVTTSLILDVQAGATECGEGLRFSSQNKRVSVAAWSF